MMLGADGAIENLSLRSDELDDALPNGSGDERVSPVIARLSAVAVAVVVEEDGRPRIIDPMLPADPERAG